MCRDGREAFMQGLLAVLRKMCQLVVKMSRVRDVLRLAAGSSDLGQHSNGSSEVGGGECRSSSTFIDRLQLDQLCWKWNDLGLLPCRRTSRFRPRVTHALS